ncbi:MAG: hypothetical protein HRU19_07285 [Pseudobacteriovorax sp.]|nr:hypothetical protein [Pseudobacteriovorax sp.]
MSSDRKQLLSSYQPWRHGYRCLKAQFPLVLVVSTLGLALPLILLNNYRKQFASTQVAIFESWISSNSPISIENYLSELREFTNSYIGSGVIPYLICLATILFLIRRTSGVCESATSPLIANDIKAVVKTLPKVILALILLLIGSAGVLLFGAVIPGIFGILQLVVIAYLTLAYAVPIYLSQGHSTIASLKKSLRIEYCNYAPVGRFSAFFQIFTYQLIGAALIELVTTGSYYLYAPDKILGTSRSFFYDGNIWPNTVYFHGIEITTTLITSLIFSISIVFMTSYYHLVKSIKSKPNIEVQA